LLKENKDLILDTMQRFIDEEGEAPTNVSVGVQTKDSLLKPKKKEEEDMEKVEQEKSTSAAVRLNRILLNMKESKRMVKVIRHGTMKRKVQCSPEQRVVDGKCVTKTSKDKMMFRKASKKRQRKMAGKSKNIIMRKRERSMIKRTNMGL
jgi:hypothetical protein